ncbi:hypothetical protein [Streptomyces sp. NPDC091268]|uniref:hypothetical protein n=1 Tax=Streptomyces sp. NPDC091268 TaxID=3365979 RepID=UPI00380418FB
MDTEFEKHMEAAERLAARALGPYESRPPREDIDLVLSELIRVGLPLATKITSIPASERFPLAEGAVSDWRYFTGKGALDDSDHAAWNYTRGLARVVRSMTGGIREHQPTSAL